MSRIRSSSCSCFTFTEDTKIKVHFYQSSSGSQLVTQLIFFLTHWLLSTKNQNVRQMEGECQGNDYKIQIYSRFKKPK